MLLTDRCEFRWLSATTIQSGLASLIAAFASAIPAAAVDYQGTVQFQGNVIFEAPIAGIDPQDIEVTVKDMTEATANGVKCSILSTTGDNANALGEFPGSLAGTVSAEILVERGGPNLPEGACIVTLQGRGTDGISASARGSTTLFVDVNDVNAQSTLTNIDITVRQSKAVASLDKECFKWAKKQLKKRAKCNFLLLKKGPEKADKCKDAGPEPAGCDDGNHVEAILALAHDGNDQQTDPFNAQAVDFAMLRDQVICQKRLGKAAANFAKKRMKLVQRKCLDANQDSESCRDQQTNAAKKKLDQIDKCQGDQMVDGGSGLTVPDVAAPCDTCIDGLGVVDRKCLKNCFQVAVSELTDGIIGDLPVCGDGILQAPEFCDDGNLVNGDCCSDTCTVEAGSTEGPMGDATCSDLLDNDCDGNIDAADTDCQ